MATQRKPAARKSTAAAKKTPKRTPVRKKAVIAPAKTESTVAPGAVVLDDAPASSAPVSEQERQAKLEAYHTLKQAGITPPAELTQEVEGWIAELNAQRDAQAAQQAQAAEVHQAQVAEANVNGPWYVRNNVTTPFNFRLDRQTEKRRIELKARGQAGDLHPLKDEDLRDPILRTNASLGLIEVIPAGEAALIIDKQTTNMGRREHTPLAVLASQRHDELGRLDPGPVELKVEAEFNRQGVTVATVDQRQMQGQLHDRDVGGRQSWGGLQRVQPGQQVPQAPQQEVRSAFVPTGGNPAIISQGGMDNNARAKAVDDLARRKGQAAPQGPAAGLGDVKVVVDPVQRT